MNSYTNLADALTELQLIQNRYRDINDIKIYKTLFIKIITQQIKFDLTEFIKLIDTILLLNPNNEERAFLLFIQGINYSQDTPEKALLLLEEANQLYMEMKNTDMISLAFFF